MGIALFPDIIRKRFELHEWKHATAILKNDFPSEWNDLLDLLNGFQLPLSWIATPGGSKSPIAKSIDTFLTARGWIEKEFVTSISVDGVTSDSPTHLVDCYKNRIALEVERNNKDPFFDRDLNNFRLLFDLRTISVGVIITRADELQEVVKEIGRSSSFGASTTHMSKLLPRILGGGGGGCPLLVVGLTKNVIDMES